MWLELLVFILGLAYGFLKKGKENLWELLKTGIIIGVVSASSLPCSGC